MRRVIALASITLTALSLTPATALAAPDWSLDPTFANAGVLRLTDLRPSAFSDVTARDGRIVSVGTTIDGGDGEVLVTVTNKDGIPDSTFSGDGFVGRPGLADQARGASLAVDGSGMVTAVVASSRRVAIMQWTAAGTRNTAFSGDGMKVLRVRQAIGYHTPQVAIDQRGRVVVAAMTGSGTASDVVVYRLLQGGALDKSFSGDGVRTIDDGAVDWVDALATDADNRVLVATNTYRPTSKVEPAALVHRLTEAGRFDGSFSGDGVVALRLAPRGGNFALHIEPVASGMWVALGGFSERYGVARLTANGSLDASYGDAGLLSINCTCEMSAANLRNGSAAFAGARPGLTASVVARLDVTGTSVVVAEYDVVPERSGELMQAVAVQSERTVLVGSAYSADPVMARLQ